MLGNLATTSEPDDLRAIERIDRREPAGLRIVAGDYTAPPATGGMSKFSSSTSSFAFTAAALAMPAVVARKGTVIMTADADENFDLDFAELKRRWKRPPTAITLGCRGAR